MKQLLFVLICFCTYSLKGWSGEARLLGALLVSDTIPEVDYKNAAKYSILYPSPIEHHILIMQQDPKKMHIRLLNLGGQVLREQWTKALETDLYVKNLKGLFIVEIQYEGEVFSKTILIN